MPRYVFTTHLSGKSSESRLQVFCSVIRAKTVRKLIVKCMSKHIFLPENIQLPLSKWSNWGKHTRTHTHAERRINTFTELVEKKPPIDKRGHRVHSNVIYWTRSQLTSSGLFLWPRKESW